MIVMIIMSMTITITKVMVIEWTDIRIHFRTTTTLARVKENLLQSRWCGIEIVWLMIELGGKTWGKSYNIGIFARKIYFKVICSKIHFSKNYLMKITYLKLFDNFVPQLWQFIDVVDRAKPKGSIFRSTRINILRQDWNRFSDISTHLHIAEGIYFLKWLWSSWNQIQPLDSDILSSGVPSDKSGSKIKCFSEKSLN